MQLNRISLFSLLVLNLIAITSYAMDKARIETRVEEVHNELGLDGEGVLVGVIDRGIDWRSNDFRNEDGTTRIKYIFDFGDPTGANAPGNPYGIGTIFTEEQINAALTGGTQIPHRDAVGHESLQFLDRRKSGRRGRSRNWWFWCIYG